MLSELHNEYDVSVYLFYPDGEFKDQLPENVRLLSGNLLLKSIGMTLRQALNSRNPIIILFRVLGAIWSKLFTNNLPISIAINSQKTLGNFDIAISYIQDSNNKTLYSGCNEFVLKKVSAKKKIAWIHGDYELSGLNNSKNNEMYPKFDQIVTVSKGCKDGLLKILPNLKDKVTYAYNFYNIDEILALSCDYTPHFELGNKFKLVTVARLGWEKGHLRAIDAIKRLSDEGFEFEWYIIGDGLYKKKISEKISEYQLQDKVLLLGHRTNPYPFIKNADLFFLPSIHEAAPMTIGESKICMTPILATNYISAKEQIDEGKDGIVTENSEEGIYLGLREILQNKNKVTEFKKKLLFKGYNNEIPLSQHRSLFS